MNCPGCGAAKSETQEYCASCQAMMANDKLTTVDPGKDTTDSGYAKPSGAV